MPALASRTHPIMSIVRKPVCGRIRIGDAALLLGYFAALLSATLYRANPITNWRRPAYVAVSQIPVVFMLAAKNNIVSVLVGAAYDHVRRSNEVSTSFLI